MLPSVVTEFTPWMSLIGGVLIGLSAVFVMLFLGRVTGISGITTGAVGAAPDDGYWRIFFILGLIATPLLVTRLFDQTITQTVSTNVFGMIVAGLLVGCGTVLGSGCTSGHGVCGLARLSVRSLVAVVSFMAFALATVFILRHVLA